MHEAPLVRSYSNQDFAGFIMAERDDWNNEVRTVVGLAQVHYAPGLRCILVN